MIDEAGIVGDIQVDPSEDNNTVNNSGGIGEKGNLYDFYKTYCVRYLPNCLNN